MTQGLPSPSPRTQWPHTLSGDSRTFSFPLAVLARGVKKSGGKDGCFERALTLIAGWVRGERPERRELNTAAAKGSSM